MRRLLLFAVVAMLFAACTQDIVVDVTNPTIADNTPETLVVGFEDDETRIQLNEAQKTVWTKGDLVSVFYRSNANSKWQFQGQTGERTGNLKCIANGQATQELPDIVVVYPYNESYYINPRTCNVQASLPATQTYLADSYGLNGNIMISQSEYNQIALKSVCGWLKVQLTGNGEKVKSITLNGNNGEQVAGQIYINSADATCTLAAEDGLSGDDSIAGGNLVFDDTIFTSVTLNCGEGVTLGSEPTAFYIALPPQEFSKGLTIEIKDFSDFVMTKSTDKTVNLTRNAIQPMSAFEFVNPNTPTPPTPANNEIRYVSKRKLIPYYDSFDTFGANIVSNIWDSETGKGVIILDSDVTIIGDYAFYGGYINDKGSGELNVDTYTLTSIEIPSSVKSIGANAFSATKLESINIPEGVISIGNQAFDYCRNLTCVNLPNSLIEFDGNPFSRCHNLVKFTGKFTAQEGRCLVVDGVLRSFASCELSEFIIPDNVIKVGKSCFKGCRNLTSIIICDSVTEIADYAFYYCENLTSLSIGRSVATIGDYAFAQCKNLTEIVIPSAVTWIGEYAFYNCEKVKYFYSRPTSPPHLGYTALGGHAIGRRIYVPASTDDSILNEYKAKRFWSDYASDIVGYDF